MNPYIGHDSQIWTVRRIFPDFGSAESIWGTFPRAGMLDRHIMTGERIIFSNPLRQDF